MQNPSEILKRRALGFLKDAEADFERGEYDLVLFHVEQFLQLMVKSILYEELGSYPKIHSVTRLIKELAKIRDLHGFYLDNIEMLNLLEEAYITSRYLPREYDREIAERALSFAKKALEVLK